MTKLAVIDLEKLEKLKIDGIEFNPLYNSMMFKNQVYNRALDEVISQAKVVEEEGIKNILYESLNNKLGLDHTTRAFSYELSASIMDYLKGEK